MQSLLPMVRYVPNKKCRGCTQLTRVRNGAVGVPILGDHPNKRVLELGCSPFRANLKGGAAFEDDAPLAAQQSFKLLSSPKFGSAQAKRDKGEGKSGGIVAKRFAKCYKPAGNVCALGSYGKGRSAVHLTEQPDSIELVEHIELLARSLR